MATRRPRVKVAANLSIRRPAKAAGSAVEQIKTESPHHVSPPIEKEGAQNAQESATTVPPPTTGITPKEDVGDCKPDKPQERVQEFKLPKPVDDVVKPGPSSTAAGPESTVGLASTSHYPDEPMSPRKADGRPTGFVLPLARKRNRTESLTSNKSLPDGVTVNKVARKVASKQEESQRTLDNKKEIRKRLTNIANVDKQNLTMFDMIYYNPVNNPMTTPPALSLRGSMENLPKSEGLRSRSVSKSRSPTPTPAPDGPKLAAPPEIAPVQLTPQLKLGPNGEMILDEASLVIENEREREMRETLANTDIVYQDEFSGNSGYYSRIRRTKDWADDETIRFYRCLHTIGTDFSLMLTLFPKRSRRDLKLKFKKEERLNLQLVNKALLYPKQFNLDELRKTFAEEDEEVERLKQAEQQRLQEEQEAQHRERMQKKSMIRMATGSNPQKRLSKSQRAMVDGEELLDEDVKKPKIRKTAPKSRKSARKMKPIKTEIENLPESRDDPTDGATGSQPLEVSETPAAVHDNTPFGETTEPCDIDEPCGSEPYVMYEKSAATYDDVTIPPTVKYQYNGGEDEELAGNDGGAADRDQDDSSTVITLQNLDDQSHTTCAQMDVTPPSGTAPMINEHTPVEIKYGEFDSEADLVFLTGESPNATAEAHPHGMTCPELIEIRLGDEYASSSGTIIIPDVIVPPSKMATEARYDHQRSDEPMVECNVNAKQECDEQSTEANERSDIKAMDTQSMDDTPREPPVSTDEHETVPSPGRSQRNSPVESDLVDDFVAGPVTKPDIEESDDEDANTSVRCNSDSDADDDDDDGADVGFSLEDIDINSLVLVESQDAGDPNRTIYEIFVTHPETGQLSERPLDVPPDVIENIRMILEAGER